MYTISLFKDKDPSTLLVSIDWVHAMRPHQLLGAPDCFLIESDIEDKEIAFCLGSDAEVGVWLEGFVAFGKCNKG